VEANLTFTIFDFLAMVYLPFVNVHEFVTNAKRCGLSGRDITQHKFGNYVLNAIFIDGAHSFVGNQELDKASLAGYPETMPL
jgi:hypothetical protein